MRPTFLINHGGGPSLFLEPGPMRDARNERKPYLHARDDALIRWDDAPGAGAASASQAPSISKASPEVRASA